MEVYQSALGYTWVMRPSLHATTWLSCVRVFYCVLLCFIVYIKDVKINYIVLQLISEEKHIQELDAIKLHYLEKYMCKCFNFILQTHCFQQVDCCCALDHGELGNTLSFEEHCWDKFIVCWLFSGVGSVWTCIHVSLGVRIALWHYTTLLTVAHSLPMWLVLHNMDTVKTMFLSHSLNFEVCRISCI